MAAQAWGDDATTAEEESPLSCSADASPALAATVAATVVVAASVVEKRETGDLPVAVAATSIVQASETVEISSAAALAASGGKLLENGRKGVAAQGWVVETRRGTILKARERDEWEKLLSTTHLPEMVFGENELICTHVASGVTLHFNALDALKGWRKEALPPVEVPAAEKWKQRSKPSKELVMDYDYTYTTPYAGSERFAMSDPESGSEGEGVSGQRMEWRHCDEEIDMAALQARDPILFYDEVVLYEDELADSGVALLTVKVRVMPQFWFALLRYWLRVDGALMRLRDCRVFCYFSDDPGELPYVIREYIQMEDSFSALASRGLPADSAFYPEPTGVVDKLTVKVRRTEKLHQVPSV